MQNTSRMVKFAPLVAVSITIGCSQPVELSLVQVEAEVAPEVLQLAEQWEQGLVVEIQAAGLPRTVALVCHRGEGGVSIKLGDGPPEPHQGGPLIVSDEGAEEGCVEEIEVRAGLRLAPSVTDCAPELNEAELHQIEPGEVVAEKTAVATGREQIVCWDNSGSLPINATVFIPLGDEPAPVTVGTPSASQPAPVRLTFNLADVMNP